MKFLDINSVEAPEPPTGKLADWYANLVPTVGGDLIVFANERSLVTVAIPAREAENLVVLFRARARNLLAMLSVSKESINREISNYEQVQFAKTANRSVLGSMKEIALNYQFIVERGEESGYISLSDAEYRLSNMPSIARGPLPVRCCKGTS